MSDESNSTARWFWGDPTTATDDVLIFAIHYAGGSASVYRPWQADVPQGLRLCPAQLPGRGDRLNEEPLTRIEALVEQLTCAIEPHLDQRYVLMGHSVGGTIAYELACEIIGQGLPPPKALVVTSTRAPNRLRTLPELHTMSNEELVTELQRYGGTPAAVLEHPEILESLLPALRADAEVGSAYRWTEREPLPIPIIAFGGTEDQIISREDIEAWRAHSTFSVDVYHVEGAHFFPFGADSEIRKMIFNSLSVLLA